MNRERRRCAAGLFSDRQSQKEKTWSSLCRRLSKSEQPKLHRSFLTALLCSSIRKVPRKNRRNDSRSRSKRPSNAARIDFRALKHLKTYQIFFLLRITHSIFT